MPVPRTAAGSDTDLVKELVKSVDGSNSDVEVGDVGVIRRRVVT